MKNNCEESLSKKPLYGLLTKEEILNGLERLLEDGECVSESIVLEGAIKYIKEVQA